MSANQKRCWGLLLPVVLVALVVPGAAGAQAALEVSAIPAYAARDAAMTNTVTNGGPTTVNQESYSVEGGPAAGTETSGLAGVAYGGSARAAAVALPRTGFRDVQLRFPRVRQAYSARADRVESRFERQGVVHPAEIYFRVFKREQLLEVWARDASSSTFVMINTYPVCGTSGDLGPKRREGDEQIPEGFYNIDLFNPSSNYHLSLRVDYPNEVDRARGRTGRLGGNIFIHGGCATIGCVPVTDEWMEEVYLMAIAARDLGQDRIPVHLFPTHMDEDGMAWLREQYGEGHPDFEFWQGLRPGYTAFEATRVVPTVEQHRGRYVFPIGVASQE